MFEVKQKETKREQAYLVGIQHPGQSRSEAEGLLAELSELVQTAGMNVVGAQLVILREPKSTFLVGSGKAEEIMQTARNEKADIIIFDEELQPSQQRNWEQALKEVAVIDRQEVILEIFASRAQTREAVLQVALARMEYSLPRLKRAWTHLSRQRGGSVMQRGVGETQLETDQRIVRDRIAKLKKELKEVVKQRGVQRKRRLKVPLPTAAIVGYTNAGKSTLLNQMTASDVLAEDKLFATLDPTTRRLELESGQVLLLTDTVGFVRRLPHSLIEAFKATLEEALVGDFIVHVLDASSPEVEAFEATTQKVLEELGVEDKPVIRVFNKVDLLEDPIQLATLKAKYPEAVFMSALSGEGRTALLEALEKELEKLLIRRWWCVPHDRYDQIAFIHEHGQVENQKTLEEGTYVFGALPARLSQQLKGFESEGPREIEV